VALRDVGDRLDVRKTDDRDIEAALKIAAKKFDIDKGLLLTGDNAFKVRAAEIRGRLGYPLQNTEPEVLRAWMKGKHFSPKGLNTARMPKYRCKHHRRSGHQPDDGTCRARPCCVLINERWMF
jgi:hypothetical protein